MTDLSLIKEVSAGVFYTSQEIVFADDSLIKFLKNEAQNAPLLRARLCAHPSTYATQQDMIIVTHSSSYVPPHRHPNKSETLLILEGKAKILIFSDNGLCKSIIPMGPYGTKQPFFYRMPENKFHSMVVETDWLVFQESTKGPFSPSENQTAEWCPKTNEIEAGRNFLEKYQ